MLEKILLLPTLTLFVFLGCIAQKKNNRMQNDTPLVYKIRNNNSSTTKLPLLVLLHGHGSNENDLLSLSSSLPDNWLVVSVRAPFQLSENSYRWYDVKMANEKIVININDEEKSREKLMQLIDEITQKHNADSQKIIVAGFSQGANMAQSLGLGNPTIAAGFGVFSGRYLPEFTPYLSKSKQIKKIQAFVAHGSGDKMLPKLYADENIKELNNLGIQITYCEDSNGHSISTKQWNEFSKWLLNFN